MATQQQQQQQQRPGAKQKRVSFSDNEPEVYEMNPSMFIRNREQQYPEELADQVYDRRTFCSKRKYSERYYKIILDIQKASPEAYERYQQVKADKKWRLGMHQLYIRHSEEIAKLWDNEPKKRHHYDISPDTSDSE